MQHNAPFCVLKKNIFGEGKTPLPHLVSRGLACMQYANINNIQTFWCIIRFRSVGSTIINVYRKSIIDLYSWLWKCGLNDEMNENSDYTTFSMFLQGGCLIYHLYLGSPRNFGWGGSVLCCSVFCFVLFVFVLCLVYPMLTVYLDCLLILDYPFGFLLGLFDNIRVKTQMKYT